jgi:tripartite-type tricarboxylate transporter receptor subunit TctC
MRRPAVLRTAIAHVEEAALTFSHYAATAERFAPLGVDPKWSSPEDFQQVIQADLDKWGKLISAANIKGE